MGWNKKIRLSICNFIYSVEGAVLSSIHYRSWVSYQAEHLLKKNEPFKKLLIWWNRINQPKSWISLTIKIVCQIILFQLIWIFLSKTFSLRIFSIAFPQQTGKEIISNVWQVMAAILGLSLVIAVLLIEFVQSRVSELRILPLVASETKIIFVIIFGLLSLLNIGVNLYFLNIDLIDQEIISIITGFNLYLFARNIFLLIGLYGRLFSYLDISKIKNIIFEQNKLAVIQSVDNEIKRRFSKNKVIALKKNGIKIDYDPSNAESKTSYKEIIIPIEGHETKEIIDVNIKIINIIKKKIDSINRSKEIETPFVFYGIPFFHRISSEKSTIGRVHKHLYSPRIEKLLQASVQYASPVKKIPKSWDENLRISRDILSIAISENRAEEVEELLNQYVEFITVFLERIQFYGLVYNSETAKKEDGVFSSWPTISIINDQYVSLLKNAVLTQDQEIRSSFIYFPRQVMHVAIKYSDRFIFLRFSSLYHYIYYLSKKNGEEIIEKIVQNIVNDYRFYILPKLKAAQSADEFNSIKEFGNILGLLLNKLLKRSFDFSSLHDFNKIVTGIRELIKYTPQYLFHFRTMEIRYQTALNTEREFELESEYRHKKEANTILLEIKNTHRTTLFGMGSWIIRLFATGKISESEFDDYLENIIPVFNFNDLYNLYSEILGGKISTEDFDWSSWQLNESEDNFGIGDFQWISTPEWQKLFYVFNAVLLSSENETPEITLTPTVASKQILETIKEITERFIREDTWNELRRFKNLNIEKRIQNLVKMHTIAYIEQTRIEEDEIIKANLDIDLINSFKNKVREAWNETTLLKKLISWSGQYIEYRNQKPSKNLEVRGFFNNLNPKEFFIKQDRILYLDWGADFGRGIARGEDSFILEKFNTLQSKNVLSDNLEEELNGILARLNLNKPFIFTNYLSIQIQRKLPSYTPKWRIANNDDYPMYANIFELIEAFYNKIPVFRTNRLKENQILIVDLSQVGSLYQYLPEQSDDNFLHIEISEISIEKAEELFKNHPELAKDKETQAPLNKDEAIRHFLQRVFITVKELLDYEIIDETAGFNIFIEDLDET